MTSTKVVLADYQATAQDQIPAAAKRVRDTFSTHKTKDLEWRLVQLRKLYWAVEDFTPQITEAMNRDIHKCAFESVISEIKWIKDECMYLIKHLKTIAKDEPLTKHVPLMFSMMGWRTRKEPVGAVLILSAYNYPLQLALAPLVGAIAAGCTAVIKPTEVAPATAMVVADIVARLDQSAYAVINGGVPEASALLEEKWDKIFYTGGEAVGKIIAKKAAETLTPVVLELGGRNPAFVTKNADVKLAARRLLWGKVHNAGQVCISHNYILVDKQVQQELIDELNKSYRKFFPNGAKASPDLSRIINLRHFHRIKKMLDSTKGKIVMGGQTDESELFIEPTAVLVNSAEDSMMVDESFGPIFAIYPVNSLDEALNIAPRVHRTPLTLYAFGSKAEKQRILNEMTSGGATLNDSYMHHSVASVPFGGVGDSGSGAYGGKSSFDAFTHFRTVCETPGWVEPFIRVRYMPYSWPNLRRMAKTAPKPDFDRDGKVVKGFGYWAGLLLGLGAGSAKGAFVRWVLALVAGYVYMIRTGRV